MDDLVMTIPNYLLSLRRRREIRRRDLICWLKGIRFRISGFWIFRELVSFKNSAAVYTLDVLSFVIFGDQPGVFVFAGGNFRHRLDPEISPQPENHITPVHGLVDGPSFDFVANSHKAERASSGHSRLVLE